MLHCEIWLTWASLTASDFNCIGLISYRMKKTYISILYKLRVLRQFYFLKNSVDQDPPETKTMFYMEMWNSYKKYNWISKICEQVQGVETTASICTKIRRHTDIWVTHFNEDSPRFTSRQHCEIWLTQASLTVLPNLTIHTLDSDFNCIGLILKLWMMKTTCISIQMS